MSTRTTVNLSTWCRGLSAIAVVASALACGDSSTSPDSDDGVDAAVADSSVNSNSDSGREAGAAEAGTPAHDAAPGDAETGAHDAAIVGDASSANDAAVAGIGVGGARARICTAGSYTAPLAGLGNTPHAVQLGSTSFNFVEGAVWVAEKSALFFSDMEFGDATNVGPASHIWRMDAAGNATSFVASSGSNGLSLGPTGKLLAATHDTQSLSLYDLDTAARSNLTIRRDGKHLNSPNDLVMRSDGTVYFTDPDWQIGSRTSEVNVTGAYRVAPPLAATGTLAAESFEDGLDKPNGIALSPDEHTLYLGSSGTEIWAYDVADDGGTSNRRMFANPGASDGMTVDCAGDLYVTSAASKVVHVYAPDGTLLGDITLAETPSNLAFGGSDLQTLFITAQSHIYSIHLAVPGLPY